MRQPTQLPGPEADAIELVDVLHALADHTRLAIVATLLVDPERPCGSFDVDVAASTLSHHFKVLREAGVVAQREDGRRRMTSLRRVDLNRRFPGLLDTIRHATEVASP
jgi:DNA-binding transcriptional ArsR family regulator